MQQPSIPNGELRKIIREMKLCSNIIELCEINNFSIKRDIRLFLLEKPLKLDTINSVALKICRDVCSSKTAMTFLKRLIEENYINHIDGICHVMPSRITDFFEKNEIGNVAINIIKAKYTTHKK